VSRLPIRLRLTLAFAGVMAVVLAALGLFIYARFQHQLDSTIDQGLHNRADDVGALVAGSGGGLRDPDSALDKEESFAQVLTPEGQIFDTTPQLAGHPLLTGTDLERAARGSTYFDRASVPALEGPARLLARPAQAGGRRVVVIVGSSVDDRNESLANLRDILLIGGPAALLLASLAGYWVAGRALSPVESMRRRAAAISAAEPQQRLPLPDADDELRRLGETLNGMLGRLDTALARERAFVDDASHELRTPLSLHKTELELALRYAKTPEEMRAAIASAIVEVDRLIELAEGLLVLARSEQGKLALDLRAVGVAEMLDDVRARFGARAAESGRSLVTEPEDGLRVEGDRLRLEQALTNLVENALQHGDGEITIRAAEANGSVEVHVEDRGPGFPPEFIERAFERFSRADPARARGGAGLGLSIVEAIAQAHRGGAHASNRAAGGADVWIELPARDRGQDR
jgi:two-component system OmpR family sensor kinase